ncbi:hypothetical protein THAOC_29949, partial [Thalassiosira oceanica]
PASGVRRDDGVYPARPSALYTPAGPLGRSVASIDLKQPSMHRRSSICRLRCARDPVTSGFFLSRVSLLQAADVAGNRLSPNRADDGNRERYCLVPSSARFGDMSSDETAATEFNDSVGRSFVVTTAGSGLTLLALAEKLNWQYFLKTHIRPVGTSLDCPSDPSLTERPIESRQQLKGY